MVSLVVLVAVWLTVFSILIVWLRSRIIEEPEEQIELESADTELEMEVRVALRGQTIDIDSAAQSENQQQFVRTLNLTEAEARDANKMRSMTLISILFLPFSNFAALASTSTPFGMFGETSFIPSPNLGAAILFFIPKSTTGVTELDQMVSLCVGIITLLFSLREALKSQKREELRVRQMIRKQAANRRRSRHQRRLNTGLYFLRQVTDELDQTEDETQRRELLDKRNSIMVEMFRMVGS
ncbi:hypothetical protein NW762_012052 [Fusarium torreyae]|uniref:Uncharacterized protein n=1 Tax=Fusarium torreyae TaxID=1237075 RepID=A0A9W8RS52_9HYPO|nr:hypothetical protein NW762_012052 [Fusarium torreyae]